MTTPLSSLLLPALCAAALSSCVTAPDGTRRTAVPLNIMVDNGSGLSGGYSSEVGIFARYTMRPKSSGKRVVPAK